MGEYLHEIHPPRKFPRDFFFLKLSVVYPHLSKPPLDRRARGVSTSNHGELVELLCRVAVAPRNDGVQAVDGVTVNTETVMRVPSEAKHLAEASKGITLGVQLYIFQGAVLERACTN